MQGRTGTVILSKIQYNATQGCSYAACILQTCMKCNIAITELPNYLRTGEKNNRGKVVFG